MPNPINTKFSSGDTVPQMTHNQMRTDFDLGSDAAWQKYKSKLAKKDSCEHARPTFEEALRLSSKDESKAIELLKKVRLYSPNLSRNVTPVIQAMRSSKRREYKRLLGLLIKCDPAYLFPEK